MKARSLHGILGVIVALLAVALHQAAMADTVDVWQWRNPLPNGNSFFNVQFLNGIFIGYGSTSELVLSSDGTNWTDLSIPFNGTISQMAYGNGHYIIAGTSQSGMPIASSPDLVNWTSAKLGTNNLVTSIAFGNGVFVAGSAGSPSSAPSIWVSTNCVDWSQASTQTVSEIAYGNGHFVATPYQVQGAVLVSTDGISWNSVTIDNTNFFHSISFANGRFYADGYHSVTIYDFSALYFSADGLNWSSAPDPRAGVYKYTPIHTLFGNGILLGETVTYPSLQSTTSALFVSPDGTNFASIAANNFNHVGYSTFGNGVFVNSYLQTSVDATNWSVSAISPPSSSSYTVQDIFTATNGDYVAVTSPLLVSSNGLKFTFLTNTIPVSVSRVKFANGLFHAVGIGGALARSTNGFDWVTRNSATANSLYDIEFGNSLWVAVGTNGTITASSTGNTWALQTSDTSLSLNGIAYGNNLFVVVGNNGTVLTSSSGGIWTPQFANTAESLDKVVYGNDQFVAVGAQGTIITSSNGVDWSTRASGSSIELSDIAFGDGMFCAVGTAYPTNVVLTSTDGSTWTPRQTYMQHSFYGTGIGVRFLNGTFFLFSEDSILQSGPVRPVQLQLTSDSVTPTVTMQSSAGLVFRLQSAGTLTGPWQDLGLFTMPENGRLIFPDAAASNQPREFYRAIEP